MLMRIISFSLCIYCLLGFTRVAGAENDKAPQAKWDFGFVPQKSEVSHTFYLRNPGPGPLTITKINPGCSCTSVSKVERPIAPGDSAAIAVTFTSGRYHYRVQKTTLVETDNPEMSKQRLSILADVYADQDTTGFISASQPKLIWEAKIGQQSFEPRTVEFVNRFADTVQIEVLTMPDTLVNWSLSIRELAPGATAVLTVTPLKAVAVRKTTDVTTTLRFVKGRATIITVPLEFKY